MTRLFENFDILLDGFWTTLALTGVSALFALVLGTILGSFRVSPIAPLRWFGAAYVEIAKSRVLPEVDLERIAELATQADEHAALKAFRDELRAGG